MEELCPYRAQKEFLETEEERQEYVGRLRLNCLRYLKATSPRLLEPYKAFLSQTDHFIDARTGQETDKTPSILIQDPGAFDMIQRATNRELGLPEYYGRKKRLAN